MYFLALAADYDGTIANHGSVSLETCIALRRLKDSGRRLVLVTGRELASLKHAFPEFPLFDRIVAENGAVIYDPATDQERSVAPPPAAVFVEKLMERNVEPISVGRSIVATWAPHQSAVLDVIEELGLDLQIIFNKGAVMVLPTGVNKATGLKEALADLQISAPNVVAVGDAENDHAFLQWCGCAAAVANALPVIKDSADLTLAGDRGTGVEELIQRIIREDIRILPRSRFGLLVGVDRDGEEVFLEPDQRVLIAGESGSGKSSFATWLTERMVENRLEFCVIDPEGDYPGLEQAVSLGDGDTPPSPREAVRLLREAGVNLVVTTVCSSLSGRKGLFDELLASIVEMRGRSGRPHWLLIDEAHQLLAEPGEASQWLPAVPGTLLITVDPACLAREVLETVDVMICFGSNASEVVAAFAEARNLPGPTNASELRRDEALYWSVNTGRLAREVRFGRPRQVHKRHLGKYAVGDVGERQSFYFRGPANGLNIRASNLTNFLDLAQKVDDSTWEHHLRRGDYSTWFRHVIRDHGLACETRETEGNLSLSPCESRKAIAEAVYRRYVMPPPS